MLDKSCGFLVKVRRNESGSIIGLEERKKGVKCRRDRGDLKVQNEIISQMEAAKMVIEHLALSN